MNTPITDAAANTITIDCDDSCVSIYVYESDKIYEGGLVPAFVARRLELDRSALMEVCNRLAELDLNGTDDSLIRFIVLAHQNSATHALTAARANFPAPSTPIPEARTPQSTYQNHDQ